ncbi:MAG: hypothetical protein EBS55_14075 [Flavobacteriaceae bacterium]|nr:hypothetical protein [Flavobacteriaceae bacterium]
MEKTTTKKPIGFILLIALGLLPILCWPFFMFGSIFMFDNPNKQARAWTIFYCIISYPILLGINAWIAHKQYDKRKNVARIMAIAPLVLFLIFLAFTFGN